MDGCYTLCRKNMDYQFCQKYPKQAADRLSSWAELELDKGRKLRLILLASLVRDPTNRASTFLHLFSDPATSSQVGGVCLAGVFVSSLLLPAIRQAY
jgi:hypothetical protein